MPCERASFGLPWLDEVSVPIEVGTRTRSYFGTDFVRFVRPGRTNKDAQVVQHHLAASNDFVAVVIVGLR
jgi:hypothetical protein